MKQTNNTTEKEKEDIKTFTLWNFKQYKESVKYSNDYKRKQYKIKVNNIKKEIESLKNYLKNDIVKPINEKPTKEGFKESISFQRLKAQEYNFKIIENKDSLK